MVVTIIYFSYTKNQLSCCKLANPAIYVTFFWLWLNHWFNQNFCNSKQNESLFTTLVYFFYQHTISMGIVCNFQDTKKNFLEGLKIQGSTWLYNFAQDGFSPDSFLLSAILRREMCWKIVLSLMPPLFICPNFGASIKFRSSSKYNRNRCIFSSAKIQSLSCNIFEIFARKSFGWSRLLRLSNRTHTHTHIYT